MKKDYLKYWRIIRYYIKAKHGLNQADLDMLLFLYSERYFSKAKFEEFDNLLGWDKKRFNRLVKDGWIVLFRMRNPRAKSLYELTFKTKIMIDLIYKKLDGEEIPTSLSSNPMYAKDVSFSDKIYRNMITQMNKYIREKKQLQKNEEVQ